MSADDSHTVGRTKCIETVRDTPDMADNVRTADSGDWSDSPNMEEQTRTGTTPGPDPELPHRWALERAELQSKVDALVHQAVAGLFKSAEDLKQRIRDETLAEIQEGRRERDSLQRQIADARRELEETRAGQQVAVEAELASEREAMLAEARAEADRVIRAARAERESMLSEIRAIETRLRGLQEQIQTLLSFGSGAPRELRCASCICRCGRARTPDDPRRSGVSHSDRGSGAGEASASSWRARGRAAASIG